MRIVNNFYIKKKPRLSCVVHLSPFPTRLSSVLLLALLPSLASGFPFDGAKQRQQQLDQPEENVDERYGDDDQNEHDVDEMILVPR